MKEENMKITIKHKVFQEKTGYEEFEENLKKAIFGVLFVLLKSEEFSFFAEICFLVLELLQFMSFPFHHSFHNIWKRETPTQFVTSFLGYFQVYVLFQNNSGLYLYVFYIFICLIILVIINIIYVSYSFSRNHFGAVWPLRVLRSVVSFIVTVLFMPIFELFVSILECENEHGHSVVKFDISITCWQKIYYVHALIAIIVSISFVIICLVVSFTYFESKPEMKNHSARINSRSDAFLLISKLICILLFGFILDVKYQWFLVIVSFLLSALMFLNYYLDQPYYNSSNMKLHLICTGIYFWNNTCVLIGKIVESTNFDGLLELFFTGLPIVLVIILFLKDNKLEVLLTHINKFQKGEQCQMQIRYYLELIEKQNERFSRITLRGYIYLFEEFCVSVDCPLKKFITVCEIGEDNSMYLYQHAQVLYQNALSKFPHCAPLRISYSFFLLDRLHNKQLAALELSLTEKNNPKFDEQFIIFRYKKLIEETSDFSENENDNLDVVSNIAYQNHFNQFKQGIQKATSLYIDFWSLLISPNKNNQEDLTKLNEYGSKINVIVEDVNLNFDKMQKIKMNDPEALRLYTDFLSEILNEKEKSSTLRNRLSEIEGTKLKSDDLNNLDMNNFNQNDDNQFIILSSDKEKFGLINKISLGICMIFGYSKTELLGKNIDILMPEPYQESHKEILDSKLKDYIKMITYSKKGRVNKLEAKNVFGFGKNKSRYIIPINFKFSLLPVHDQHSALFVAKVVPETVTNDLYAPKICYVITSSKLLITHISTSAISVLGLTQNLITSNSVDLSKLFPELSEENVKNEIEEDFKIENFPEIYIEFLKKKYSEKKTIFLRKNEENSSFQQKVTNQDNKLSLINNKESKEIETFDNSIYSKKKAETVQEEKVYIQFIDLVIKGKSEGFIFKIETIVNEGMIIQNTNQNQNDILLSNIKTSENSIDLNFLPTDNALFELDPKKCSFKKTNNPLRIQQFIKKEALIKLNNLSENENQRKLRKERREAIIARKNKVSDSSSSSSSDSGREQKHNNKTNRSRITSLMDEYYVVNFQNVKFQYYHHKTNTLKDSIENYQVSQVEIKKTEEIELREFIHQIKTNTYIAPVKSNTEYNTHDSLQIKLIENALNKVETQPTIVRLKWVAFITFLIFLILVIIFFSMLLKYQNQFEVLLNLLKYSHRIITNNFASAFSSRELILLFNASYVNYPNNFTFWKNYTLSSLSLRFNETHSLQDYIFSNYGTISGANRTYLDTTNVNLNNINGNITSVASLSLSAAITQMNTRLFQIGQKSSPKEISFYDEDFYSFLTNNYGDLTKLLYKRAEIFLNEMLSANSKANNFTFVLLLVMIVFCFFSYYIIAKFYEEVGKRKESYLGIFFQIENIVIKNSLEKCEKFNKKIQNDNVSDNGSDQEEIDEDEDDNKSKKDKKNMKSASTSQNSKKYNNENKGYSSWESKVVRLKIFIWEFGKVIIFALLYYFYQNFLSNFSNYNKILDSQCLLENELNNLMNVEREVFAGDVKSIFGSNPISYLSDKLNTIFLEKEKYDNVTLAYKDYIQSDYMNSYDNLTNSNICYICDYNFTTINVNCSEFMYNSTSFGLNSAVSSYIQQLREQYVIYKQIAEKNNGTFQIFNSQGLRNLSIQLIYIIQPANQILSNDIYTSIVDYLSFFSIIYVASFIAIIVLLLIQYLFIWKPFEEDLSQTIHKTKNMLLIIPKEILAGLNNINKLLEIGNFEKKKTSHSQPLETS